MAKVNIDVKAISFAEIYINITSVEKYIIQALCVSKS